MSAHKKNVSDGAQIDLLKSVNDLMRERAQAHKVAENSNAAGLSVLKHNITGI